MTHKEARALPVGATVSWFGPTGMHNGRVVNNGPHTIQVTWSDGQTEVLGHGDLADVVDTAQRTSGN